MFAVAGITTPADFAGKNIGNWGFGNEFEIFAALAQADLDPASDVTLVQQQFDMVAGARRPSGRCRRCSAGAGPALVPSYRNDEGVPPGPDGRYALGLSERRDVEAALRYAVDHGAREVLLMGWSMGGAIVLQLLDRCRRSCRASCSTPLSSTGATCWPTTPGRTGCLRTSVRWRAS